MNIGTRVIIHDWIYVCIFFLRTSFFLDIAVCRSAVLAGNIVYRRNYTRGCAHNVVYVLFFLGVCNLYKTELQKKSIFFWIPIYIPMTIANQRNTKTLIYKRSPSHPDYQTTNPPTHRRRRKNRSYIASMEKCESPRIARVFSAAAAAAIGVFFGPRAYRTSCARALRWLRKREITR